MRITLFYHSLVSDWNHGNAHFLRGVARELLSRGHQVQVFEPEDGWSRRNLIEQHGEAPIAAFHRAYPELQSRFYRRDHLDLERIAQDSDLVIVHEWNEPWLVAAWNRLRASRGGFRLLFHDTHHRAVSDPQALAQFALDAFDGVLAFGEVLREIYQARGWARAAWTWHEAADTRLFRPLGSQEAGDPTDLIWIGNWGDDERSQELEEFLFAPTRDLGLKLRLHGVRYPGDLLARLAAQGVQYRGWLPNFEVPRAFAQARVTLHVPRRPYAQRLPGIPTIRPFEAMACGIPLVCAPWTDSEGLFQPGRDYLVARNGAEMRRHLRRILRDAEFARELAQHALRTIRERHSCAHRVDQLLHICAQLGLTEAAADNNHKNIRKEARA